MANFKKYTRYTNGHTFTDREGRNFLILRSPLDLPSSSNDVFITITSDIVNRPDLIASKAYNNPDLWWVIYEYNNIRDPLFDLKTGQTIKIPSLDRVIAAINSIGT